MPAPTLDHDLSLPQRIEDFTIEQLVSEAGIKALDVAVLHGLPGAKYAVCEPIARR